MSAGDGRRDGPREDQPEVLGQGRDGRVPRVPQWLTRAVLGFVVVVLAVTVGPGLLASDRGRDKAPAPDLQRAQVVPLVPAELRWATRGDLAGDGAFLAAVRLRLEGRELNKVGEVLWAGRLASGRGAPVRAALVAGGAIKDLGDSISVPVVGVLVPAGTAMGDARVDEVDAIDLGDRVVGWRAEVGGGRVVAVVVGPPGPLSVRISDGVSYGLDGTPHRTFAPRSGADGVILADLPDLDYPAPALADDQDIVSLLGPSPAASSTRPAIEGYRTATYAGPPSFLLTRTVAAAVSRPPLAGASVRVRLLWNGAVGHGAAALVLYTRADGATFHQWLASVLGATPTSTVYPVPRREALTYPAVVEVQSAGPGGATTAVVDPAGPGTVTFVDVVGDRVTHRSNDAGLTAFGAAELADGHLGWLVLHDRLGSRTIPVDSPAVRDPLALAPSRSGSGGSGA